MMKKLIWFLLIIMALSAFQFHACRHEPDYLTNSGVITTSSCSPDTVYFVNDLQPLLQSNCDISGCHDGTSSEEAGPLTDYSSVISTGGVKPYRPSDSKLYTSVTGGGEEKMPPSPQTPLTQDQINMISKWIDQGAFNNFCIDANCDSINVTYSGTIWPIIQNKCTGCHSGATPGGNILLGNFDQVKATAVNGKLMGSIIHAAGFKPMPQNGNKLSDCNIAQIRKWITDGTPNN
jgi:mono/diheme cytochrome c family protein